MEAANAGYSVRFYSIPVLINKLKELKMHKNLLSIHLMDSVTSHLIGKAANCFLPTCP
ncbi:MAG: hypothetical protein ACRC3H_24600 [Lachnospiraceae bacterium]